MEAILDAALDAVPSLPYLLCGAIICMWLFLLVYGWLRTRLDEEFDRGFRAGLNPEAGGWEYEPGIGGSRTLPPRLKDAAGYFVAPL